MVNLGVKDVIISRGEKVVARDSKVGDVLVFCAFETRKLPRKASVTAPETLIWHRRLGHPV